MSPEVVPKFLLVDDFWFLMGFNISIAPICSVSNQLRRCKENHLSVGTLDDLLLLQKWSSINHRHPLAQRSERMSEV
jgi:hypothetical protein